MIEDPLLITRTIVASPVPIIFEALIIIKIYLKKYNYKTMKKKQTKINKQEITIKTNKTKNNNKNNNSVTVPVKLYPNSDISKDQILSDNKNKSGIYM